MTAPRAASRRAGAGIGVLAVGRVGTSAAARAALLGLAWCAGALAGIAPEAFVGDPPAGVLAGVVLGACAWGWTAPVVVTPWVATVLARDDELGTAVTLHAAGVGLGSRLGWRGLAAALDVVVAAGVAAVAGGWAAATRSAAAGAWTPGLTSAPSWRGAAAALALAGAALVVGVLLAALSAQPTEALALWAGAVLLTAGAITAARFSPAFDPLVGVAPWLSLWPFDPDEIAAPTLALEIPVAARGASFAAWVGVLTVLARRRRRREPYPSGERARHRPRRSRP